MTGSAPPHREAVDWLRVRRRLEAVNRRIEDDFAPDAEQRRAELRARARALAQEAEPPPGAGLDVLLFDLAQERYAVESAWVQEVAPLRELTPLPGTPAFVRGIVHLRGEVLSVLDLKTLFELPAGGLPDLDKLIVLSDGAMRFGVLADRIHGMQRLPLADLQPPLPTLSGVRADYLLGIGRPHDVVLDARKLLADPRIVVRHDAASGPDLFR